MGKPKARGGQALERQGTYAALSNTQAALANTVAALEEEAAQSVGTDAAKQVRCAGLFGLAWRIFDQYQTLFTCSQTIDRSVLMTEQEVP